MAENNTFLFKARNVREKITHFYERQEYKAENNTFLCKARNIWQKITHFYVRQEI